MVNSLLETDAGCSLGIGRPTYATFDDLGTFEARLRISSDHNSEAVNHGLLISTSESDTSGWYALCGLYADERGNPIAYVDVTNKETGQREIDNELSVDYDQWYTFRLETEPDSLAVSCLVDDNLIGSLTPSNALAYRNARFQRFVGGWRSPNSFATTDVDDVRLVAAPETTAASGPTSAPSPATAAGADPTLYDNFDNPALDGAWDTARWKVTFDAGEAHVEQKEGVLMITGQSSGGNGLNAIRPGERTIDEIGMIEAKVMLDSNIEAARGEAGLVIGGLSTGGWWYMGCNVSGQPGDGEARAGCNTGDGYETEAVPVQFDTWYTLRLEVSPDTAAITFFIDGQPIDEFLPADPEAIKKAIFSVDLAVFSEDDGVVTGYFDDVRLGQVGQ
jgi:hypothetical protein